MLWSQDKYVNRSTNVTSVKVNQFVEPYDSSAGLVSTFSITPAQSWRKVKSLNHTLLHRIIPIWQWTTEKWFISKVIQVFLCPLSIVLFGTDFLGLNMRLLWGSVKSYVWHLLLLFYPQLLSHKRKLDYSDTILFWQIRVDSD